MSKNIIICLMGMDGSGKSTLSRCLLDELNVKNFHASYIWWLEGESTFFRKILRKYFCDQKKSVFNQQNLANQTHRVPVGSLLFQKVYPQFVLLDYLIFGIMKTRFMKRGHIRIFDRYYYDVIFSLSNEFHLSSATQKRFLSLYKWCIPDPTLLFICDVPPEVAYNRKKEEFKTLENAYVIGNTNKNICEFVENNANVNSVRIDTSDEIEICKRKLISIVLKEIGW